MRLSIRNQLAGTVTAVVTGEVMASVKVRLAGGHEITAAITAEAVEDLGLAAGSSVTVLVKSTAISVATGALDGVTIRNQIPGSVTDITTGGAMARVRLTVEGGEVTAVVTKEAVGDLGLVVGSSVVALIKATEVSLATA